jgi:hypothetical protein
MRSDFCVFILTHNRVDRQKTYGLLRKLHYTGPIFLVVDNEDPSLDEYFARYGDEVVVFNKRFYEDTNDFVDNLDKQNQVVNARNALWDICRELGYKYFLELDDDYYYFGHKEPNVSSCYTYDLDAMFEIFVKYLESTPITSIAFAQGGDHIGGYDGKIRCKRKVMNSFFCDVDRPFKFIGRINEDTTMYVRLGTIGKIFLTIMNVKLDQLDTQQNKGGLTDIYLDMGTYVKSFYSVIVNPSCVKVRTMGAHARRLHHSISWDNATPMIIDEKYKKR